MKKLFLLYVSLNEFLYAPGRIIAYQSHILAVLMVRQPFQQCVKIS